MKVIFKILKRDFKKVIKNPIALLVIIALTILPSLYAWFNINANWDPYSNTGDIKVAVYNEDQGATLDDVAVNFGDEIIEKLHANHQIGWQFVSKEEAMEGVNNGAYYAGVIIPKDFSQKFISITTNNIERPSLDYYVNEKINAIVPKITDKGISSLQEQVNQTFVSIASETILTISQKVEKSIEENGSGLDKIVNNLHNISKNIDTMVALLNSVENQSKSLDETTALMQTSLDQTNILLNDAADTVNKFQGTIIDSKLFANNVNNTIGDQLNNLGDSIEALDKNAGQICDDLDKAGSNANTALKNLSNSITSVATSVNHAQSLVDSLNKLLPTPSKGLTNLSKSLQGIKEQLSILTDAVDEARSNTGNLADTGRKLKDKISQSLNNQKQTLDNIYNDYNNNLKPSLNQTTNSLYNGLSSTSNLLNSGSTLLPYLSSTLTSLGTLSGYTLDSLQSTKDVLIMTQKDINSFAAKLENNLQTEKIQQLADLIKNDPKLASQFISSPVEVNKIELYSIPNYGSAMTPFYTILCLWVGALILVAILSCHVKEDEELKDLKPYQTYWGRYLFFMILAIIQAVIVSLGDFYILGTYCTNKLVFTLVAILASIVFSNIVFTLTSTFGDVGKAMAVIALVLQVAGSGGTFPVEVTNLFFKIINPLMPFTHAIRAMREAVGGIYTPTLISGILGLLAFLIPSLAIALLFRKPLAKFMHVFEEKMKETGFM